MGLLERIPRNGQSGLGNSLWDKRPPYLIPPIRTIHISQIGEYASVSPTGTGILTPATGLFNTLGRQDWYAGAGTE